jgi:NADPH:quinone reductase-like Zn-dependent oxidoreductase
MKADKVSDEILRQMEGTVHPPTMNEITAPGDGSPSPIHIRDHVDLAPHGGDAAYDTAARMRAVVQTRYGSADVLHIGDVARPEVRDNEVLVRVHAAGIDRGTAHLMAGKPYLVRLVTGLHRPRNQVPGRDVAGTVVAVGAKVTRFQVGDEVFGISRGSFAEYACAREDRLVPKPANLSFAQAAVMPVSGLAALQGLRDSGRLEAGQRVLIVGASGGVGTFAVQIARALGAEVTGVCSTAKLDLVRSLGAGHVIDYAKEDFANAPQRYDLILDIGGDSPLSRLRRALTPRGTLVLLGGEGGDQWTGMGRQLRALVLSPFVRHRLTFKMPNENHVDIERLALLVEAGELVPVIDRAYPLHEASDAMRHLEAGQARGKIVITV